MYRWFIFPSILGLGGALSLIFLGIWQMERLEWKTNILLEIEKKISAEPVELVNGISKIEDQYRSIKVEGELKSNEVHVLTSIKNKGPGFRIITPLELKSGKVILVDRGFVSEADKNTSRQIGEATFIGNLLWPNETDGFTPAPDIAKNIWFARNLNLIAKHLNTEEILLVARVSSLVDGPITQPIGLNVPNDHLGYAITWFSLAIVWLGMTLYLVWRIKKQNGKF